MVNNNVTPEPISGLAGARLRTASSLTWAYVGITVASALALVILSSVGSSQATSNAWGHAVIVVVFAILLPLRMGAARRGSARALRAVAVIAAVALVVNVVEAVLPGVFPVWMRVEMVVIALVMAGIIGLVLPALRRRAGQ